LSLVAVVCVLLLLLLHRCVAAAIFSLIAYRPQPSLSLRPQTTLNYLSLSPDVRMPAAPRYHNAC
jgi:hypothetical protein